MHLPYPIFATVDQEWRTFAASPEAAAALTRWRRAEPAFAGMEHVEDALRCRRDEGRAAAVLHALARRAATDEVAARVLLQAMLPALVRLAVKYGDGDPDTAGHVLAIAWERIRTYPSDRCTGVAGNLLMDVRKCLLAERAPIVGVPGREELAPSAEDEALPWLLLSEIAKVEKAGRIPRGSTELMLRTRVEGHSIVDIAARRGVSGSSLHQRRRRAEARLRRRLDAA